MQLGMNINNGNKKPRNAAAEQNNAREFSSFEDLDNAMAQGTVNTENQNKSSINKTAIIAGGIAAVIVIILLIIIATMKDKTATEYTNTEITEPTSMEETADSSQVLDEDMQGYLEQGPTENPGNGIYDADGNVISDSEDIINPGISEFNTEGGTTTATVYNADDFIKDLNGVDISAVYNVKSYNYLFDYVNYEKRRAIMDDGMELYWLDITYHNKKYRCTVPFYVFKSLDTSGITRVKLELLTLDGGEKVISYMRVAEEGEE